jgi:hypothetical protein
MMRGEDYIAPPAAPISYSLSLTRESGIGLRPTPRV